LGGGVFSYLFGLAHAYTASSEMRMKISPAGIHRAFEKRFLYLCVELLSGKLEQHRTQVQ